MGGSGGKENEEVGEAGQGGKGRWEGDKWDEKKNKNRKGDKLKDRYMGRGVGGVKRGKGVREERRRDVFH